MNDPIKTQAVDALARLRAIEKDDTLSRDLARFIHAQANDLVLRLARKHKFTRERRNKVSAVVK